MVSLYVTLTSVYFILYLMQNFVGTSRVNVLFLDAFLCKVLCWYVCIWTADHFFLLSDIQCQFFFLITQHITLFSHLRTCFRPLSLGFYKGLCCLCVYHQRTLCMRLQEHVYLFTERICMYKCITEFYINAWLTYNYNEKKWVMKQWHISYLPLKVRRKFSLLVN